MTFNKSPSHEHGDVYQDQPLTNRITGVGKSSCSLAFMVTFLKILGWGKDDRRLPL